MENNKDTAGKQKTAVKAKTVTLKAKGKSLTGQPLDNIELNPQLDNDKQVTEQSRGGVVLSFGRMNPPTVGHEKLVKKVVDVANSKRATPMLFLSHSQDKKKNPLEYADKVRFARKAFGSLVQASPAKTLIDIAKNLQSKFKEMTIVVGSDRVHEFEVLLNKYNGKEYNFDKITVVSAGERDPDAEGVEGMSASKMRAAVQDGDRQKFISGLPALLKKHGAEVFTLVSSGMKLQEELQAEGLLSEVLDINQRRKRGIIMKRYSAKIARAKQLAQKRLATNEKLKKRAQVQARDMVRARVAGSRGQEYHTLSPSERIQVDKMVEKRKTAISKLAKRIMPRVKAAEFARLKSFTQGHPLQQLHSGPAIQHEQFNQMFEQAVSKIEIVTVDSIIQEMTNLVLDKIITEKQIKSLQKRSERSGISFDILEQVYVRGLLDSMGDQTIAFNRVNAFCCGGKTAVNEDADLYAKVERKDINEDLRKWFDQKWVRMDTKGEIKGDCAREEGEGKPKCLPMAKAQAMDKEDRATAARRKRREDPVADRQGKGGKPVNVATEAYIVEKNSPTNPALWSRAKALARQKFDVYPSAYANGWAAKYYKSKGGGWKSVSENVAFENFMDGKGPGKPGDSARHGLKGKSTAELKSIRSSDSASPRKKQLAHFMLNMTRKESIEEGYDVNSKHYKALTDLDLNTKNRDMTTKLDGYGPLNPSDEKGSKSFWDEKAKMWKTTTEAAMEARCGNCAAFNQSPAIMKKMAEGLGPAGDKIQELADLGFCELFEFKCAGSRTCNKWLVNGPITESNNKPYVKAFAEKGSTKQQGWKASNKHGKVKYFGTDFKKSALKHADIDEAFAQAVTRDPSPDTPTNDSLPRKKLQKVGRSTLSVATNDADHPTSITSSHFRLQQIKKKIIDETTSLDDLFDNAYTPEEVHTDCGTPECCGKCDTADLEETAKTADKHPVVVPSYIDGKGNTIPAKTVMRKKSKPIVNFGDNGSDGQ